MALPTDPKVREVVRKRVVEAAQYLREVDTLKEDIKHLSAATKEEYEIAPKEFNNWVKAEYNAQKLQDQIETLQTALAEHQILTK
jgi:flagellar biosynthesis chaperone FliJ